MNAVTAFLYATAVAYFVAAIMDHRSTKNMDKNLERVIFAAAGTVIYVAIQFNHPYFWAILGILNSWGSYMSYVGYVKWNVQWQDEVSGNAQMFMTGWDLTMALCCITKIM